MGNFLKTLLKDREEELFFFSALKLGRLKISEERKLAYKWRGKLSPSALTFSMCPYTYLREDVHKPQRDIALSGLESMEFGKALHHHYSQEALKIKDLLYPFPEFPQNIKAKARKLLPEIYFFDEEIQVSGKIDLVLNLEDRPVVVDLKITGRPLKDFPSEAHLTQVSTYIYCLNRLKYYDKQITRGGILVQNPFEKLEKEIYFNYSDYKEKTEELHFHLNRERLRFLKGEPSQCEYKYCGRHK